MMLSVDLSVDGIFSNLVSSPTEGYSKIKEALGDIVGMCLVLRSAHKNG